MTTLSKRLFGCLLVLATSSAADAQDASSVAKVSAGTAAITAAVVLLHGNGSTSSTSSTEGVNAFSSTEGVNAFTGSDIGRGGNASGATFAGYGNNPPNNSGAPAGSGPLAPGGAAGIQTAGNGSSYESSGDSSFFLYANPGLDITIVTSAIATLSTGSTSTASTGTSP
ncbi:MAG TPA: hypothetical protein VGH23_08565 [Rhizomicrobium sp.]